MYSLWTYRPQHKLLEHWSGAQNFCQRDAETIFRIPIHAHIDQHVAWHYESRGVFPWSLHIRCLPWQPRLKDKLAQPRVIEVVHGRRTCGTLVYWDLIRSQWTELQPAPPNVRHDLWNWWSSFQRQRLTQTHGFSPHCPCGAVVRCGLTK
jgi:hypothetical protein